MQRLVSVTDLRGLCVSEIVTSNVYQLVMDVSSELQNEPAASFENVKEIVAAGAADLSSGILTAKVKAEEYLDSKHSIAFTVLDKEGNPVAPENAADDAYVIICPVGSYEESWVCRYL